MKKINSFRGLMHTTRMLYRKHHYRYMSTSDPSDFDSETNSVPTGTNQDTSESSDLVNQSNNGHNVQQQLQQTRSSEPGLVPEFPSDMQDAWKQSQERHAFRPKVDPQDTSVLLFPGQGSQFVGMGSKLLSYPNVREMYDVASGVLGYDLLDLCLNGPKSELDKTIYCQPAVMVTSLAAVEKLRDDNPKAIEKCVGAAGFSVGEFAALVFAGAISFENALEVVQVRAQAMQEASEAIPGGMISVFTGHQSRLRFACHAANAYCKQKLYMEDPVCEVANYLYPDCKVIAGNDEALDFITKNAKEFGLRRIKRLPVSGAFHTKLMLPAKPVVKKALRKTHISQPLIPVYSNMSSHWYRNAGGITEMLPKQLHKPVKWEQIMHVVYSRQQGQNFPVTYELGPGRQLGAILQKINVKAHKDYHSIDV